MPSLQHDTTEYVLTAWRFGQTQSERLCAGVLIIEDYESVDPQSPLGGPDGLKDALCVKDGKRFVAACYFPTTPVSLNAVRTKYRHDLRGIQRNKARGIVFFTNQRLSPSQRRGLNLDAKKAGYVAEVYHVERLRLLLDSPRGLGLRLKYLHIGMTIEEQTSFISQLEVDRETAIRKQAAQLENHANRFGELIERCEAFALRVGVAPDSVPHPGAKRADSRNVPGQARAEAPPEDLRQGAIYGIASLYVWHVRRTLNVLMVLTNELEMEVDFAPDSREFFRSTVFVLSNTLLWDRSPVVQAIARSDPKVRGLADGLNGLRMALWGRVHKPLAEEGASKKAVSHSLRVAREGIAVVVRMAQRLVKATEGMLIAARRFQ